MHEAVRACDATPILAPDKAGYRAPAVLGRDDWSAVDRSISELTAARLVESVPANTRRAYAAVRDSWTSWCRDAGRVALPATAETLAEYVSHMVTAGRAPSTISHHLGAIRSLHTMAGHRGQPDATAALLLLRGYRRAWAEDGRGARRALPLLPAALRQCVDALDLDTLAGRRDQLALVLGFAMMARRSELAALRLADAVESEAGLLVTIRASKTDKDSLGADVALPVGTHPALDPVALVRAWRAELAGRGHLVGPLLRAVSRHGALGGGLTPGSVCRIVQRAARRAGLPDAERYSGHSLRAGGLTASLQAGIPLGVAAEHGRWSAGSPVVVQYARAADRWRDNAMRGVL